MNHLKYLLLMLVLLVSPALRAQYNPSNPDEPGTRPWKLTLKAVPANAGYFNLNTESYHAVGEQLSLYAYDHNDYVFQQWEDAQGNILSSSRTMNYTMPAGNITLVARYTYSPDNPDEPGQASIKRHLFLRTNPEGAGHFNLSSDNNITTGENVNLHAYANQHYVFRNWTYEGTIISTSAAFAFTMPEKDATLVANYDYNYSPDNPNEPGEPQGNLYNIYGMREGALAGHTIAYPVYLQNRGNEITGLSFNISIPEGFIADVNATTLSERAATQSLEVHSLTGNTWRFIVSGAESIEGVEGIVLTIPIKVPATATVGDVFPIGLSEGVVFMADGAQENIGVRSGSVKIVRNENEQPDSPDYIISNIQTTSSEVMPQDIIHLSWQVENNGNLVGYGGWTERIHLISASGRKVTIGNTYYDTETLQPGVTVTRSADIMLSQLPGIDGDVDLGVTIVPSVGSGEATDFLTNNSAQTTGMPMHVGKRLYLTMPQVPQQEGKSATVRCQIARSGNWAASETFELKKVQGDDRLGVPQTVTIPSEQATAYFYLTLSDNADCDEDSIFAIQVSGNNYEAVEGTLVVRDDERPPMRLTVSSSEVTEGETFQLTVTLSRSTTKALPLSIVAEQYKRFRLPASKVIAAGETQVTFDVEAIDNDVPDEDITCAFTAYVTGYDPTEALVILKDNDMPILQLTLTPNKVKESDGPVSVTGTLCRTTNIDKNITVRLSDNADGKLFFTQTSLQLPKGVDKVHFNLGPVDNNLVDGDRTYTVQAAVWLSSCRCSASGQAAGSVSTQLDVFDDDGPALTLLADQGTVREGVTTRIVVSRNTSTAQALIVHLSSNYDDLLTYNHSVIIPAGQQSTYVEVTPSANNTQDDSQTIVFTAEANGFSCGTCWLYVTDQTLPDARIRSIKAANNEAEVGASVKLTVEIINAGMADLRDATPITVYRRGDDVPVARLYTAGAMAPGEQQTLEKTIILPNTVGKNSYYAIVNEENKIRELSYTNNTSVDIVIYSLSSFSATLSTDKTVYKQGDKVVVNGQLKGKNIAEVPVDVYMVNEGARQVQRITTDAQGAFTAEWQLFALQTGHFTLGACYPEENTSEEMASFNVYGLRRSDSNYITCDMICGEPFTGKVNLTNPSPLKLTGVKAEVISPPNNCTIDFRTPTVINGNETAQMSYTLTGTVPSTGRDWEQLKVHITSIEGADLEVIIYYYCRNAKAEIACNVENLQLNITKGTSREIPLELTNIGKGETGNITLALPEGFTQESATKSLSQGESASLVLRFTPTERMQLNVPMTGTIGVNCENGQGVIIPFKMQLVSEEKGFLEVDVCDEYTYNTKEAPHVEGANVVVKHPISNEVLAQGKTGQDGKFSVELTEGYYRLEVSKEKHENYAKYVFVNPAATEYIVVNISYQPITVSWDVEETEVEDEYRITHTLTYETNVPMPVVKIDIPKSIDGDNMAVGDAVMINMTLTNVGLIRADNVQTLLPEDDGIWHFESLGIEDGFSISPQQSVIIPIRITRVGKSNVNARRVNNPEKELETNHIGESNVNTYRANSPAETLVNTYGACMKGLGDRYEWACGEKIKTNEAAEDMAMEMCALSATMTAIGDILSTIFSGGPGLPGGGGGSSGGGGGNSSYGEITKTIDICDPCDAEKAKNLLETLGGKSSISKLLAAIKIAIKMYRSQGKKVTVVIKKEAKEKAKDACKDFINNKTKGISGYIAEIWEVVKPCPDKNEQKKSRGSTSRKTSNRDWQEEFSTIGNEYIKQLKAVDSIMFVTYGNRIWYEEVDDEKLDFLEWATNLPNDYIPSTEELMVHKPFSVTLEEMQEYINHINGIGPNYPTTSQLDELFDIYELCDEWASTKGYDNMFQLFEDSYITYLEKMKEMLSSSVCATISLSIEQKMTMTRQAFRGSLKVFNGHEDTPMQDLKLNLVVRDMYGRTATAHEFQINTEKLDGFSGALSLTDGWSLGAQETGTATILFIPTKYAAPNEPIQYSFGGTITYIDPFNGLEITRDLYPVTLTVNPSPELDLTYFMQRDAYGDDPLTEEVEPIVPSEFALIINNNGFGDATNVRMVTQQPQIIENEKGLLINFRLISSQVNGEPAVLNFGEAIANDFGTIPAKTQAYAQWWLTSTLLGHFVKYNVEATHVTSYGNEDLSLLDQVTIHELIHGFTPFGLFGDTNKGRGFLVNDMADGEDLPDEVYFTDGTQKNVTKAAGAITSSLGQNAYLLNITPSNTGWNYGSLPDPTNGRLQLVSIIRQRDGAVLPADNVWQTAVTLRDGKDPVHENRLHFVCDTQSAAETWVLNFEERPEVVKIEGQLIVFNHDNISVAPLPMGEKIFVKGNYEEVSQLTIYDVRGIKWIEKQNLLPGEAVYTGSLPAGVYHVKMNTDRGVYTQKVIKR